MQRCAQTWKSEVKRPGGPTVIIPSEVTDARGSMGDLTPLIEGPVKFRDGKKVSTRA